MRCFIKSARRVGRHDCNFGKLGRQLRRRRDFKVRITDCHHGPTLALDLTEIGIRLRQDRDALGV
jgi:hypothetical protein